MGTAIVVYAVLIVTAFTVAARDRRKRRRQPMRFDAAFPPCHCKRISGRF